MQKFLAAVGAAAILAFAASGAGAADKLKACFVYVGPHNDGGWSQQIENISRHVEHAA